LATWASRPQSELTGPGIIGYTTSPAIWAFNSERN
jgi:hypothetical protein